MSMSDGIPNNSVSFVYQVIASSEKDGQPMATVMVDGKSATWLRRAGVAYSPARGDGSRRSRPSFTFPQPADAQVGSYVRLNFTTHGKKAELAEIEPCPSPGQMRGVAGDYSAKHITDIGPMLKIVTAARPR